MKSMTRWRACSRPHSLLAWTGHCISFNILSWWDGWIWMVVENFKIQTQERGKRFDFLDFGGVVCNYACDMSSAPLKHPKHYRIWKKASWMLPSNIISAWVFFCLHFPVCPSFCQLNAGFLTVVKNMLLVKRIRCSWLAYVCPSSPWLIHTVESGPDTKHARSKSRSLYECFTSLGCRYTPHGL